MAITLDMLTEAIRKKVGEDCGIRGRVRFDLDDGCVYVDATQVPNIVNNDPTLPTDCTIKMSNENLHRIMLQEVNALQSFLTGHIKIQGNMQLAMAITKII
ncbi:MAG: SCP2 sterol-binding domain-containing protein [Bacteroidia bacterium]|nr:SCP2 sterol-binding domain-containing protein [Bacteroidia bacterium]MDW8157905.1 SCP2 sterol-binding domain-containing protein [Bacteroidia bacterium]